MPNKKVFRDSESEDDLHKDSDEEFNLHVDSDDDEEKQRGGADVLSDKSEDSDDAPDDIAFSDSKQSALQRMRAVMSTLSQDRQRVKQKRRNVTDKFTQQKKQKLEMLARNRLPEDLLESLSSTKKDVTEVKSSDKSVADEQDDRDSDASDQKSEERDHSERLSETDFIPFDENRESGLQVIALKEALKKPKSSAESAAEFRNSMLYGSRIKRETVKEALGKKAKRRFRNM